MINMRTSKLYKILIFSLFFMLEFALISSQNALYPTYEPRIISEEETFADQQQMLKLAQPDNNFSSYNLSVIFNEGVASVQGNLSIDFYNNDPKNFTRIPFHLYLSGMMYETKQGTIEIQKVFDQENHSQILSYNVYPNQQLMWVNLTKELKEKERASFVIQFTATLPDGPYDRANVFGYDSNQTKIFKFTGFYPIPCVYDQEDGWNVDPYLDVGDPFYFDMAYYNLFIEAPKEMIIAATGQLQEKVNKGSTLLHHFNPVYPVREVTFSASRYFQVESKLVNGVNLSTFFLPKSDELWATYAIDNAENALLLYNSTFGTYPYPTLNIVEEYTIFGGMEYPCQIYATEAVDTYSYPLSINRRILEKIIAHETCHQWWYNIVGNDEVDLPFLDEGIVVWSTDYYGEYYHGTWEYFQMVTRYIDKVRTYYAITGLSSKINQTAYEFIATNTDWVFIGYYKTPLIFEKLRQTIGHTNFINGLKLFFIQYEFKHAILSDLQKCFEDIIGTSLDWFFFPWFDNPYLPKYSFGEVEFDSGSNNLTIIIEDNNELLNEYTYRQLVPLAIYNNNGNEIYYEEIWIDDTTTINLELTETPYKVSLLYDNYVLVQLDDPNDLSLDLYLKSIPNGIPGYDLGMILVFSVHVIGLLIIFTRRNIQKNKK